MRFLLVLRRVLFRAAVGGNYKARSLVIIQMTDASILLRMSEHYETLTIANRKALALFRSELRQFSLNGPISTRKSAFASAQ